MAEYIEVRYELDNDQVRKLEEVTETFNKLANSRGKKGLTKEQVFVLSMSYASKNSVDEKMNLFGIMAELKRETILHLIDNFLENK